MKREPIVFLLVVALLGLMGWSLLQEQVPRPRRGDGGSLELPPSTLGPVRTVVELPLGSGARRDLLRRPVPDEPLAPLVLPAPPMGRIASLLPPPLPAGSAATWNDHLYADPPALQGGIGELVDDPQEETAAGAGEANPSAFLDPAQGYRAANDWVRIDAITTLYGRLLGDDRYDRQQGDTLRFLEVDPRTGRERFGERTLNGEGYEEFGFADTLRNRIELDLRRWRRDGSPARVEAMRGFVHWLLDQGDREVVAFGYAEEIARTTVRLVPAELANWMVLGEVWERSLQLDHAFALYAMLSGEPLNGPLPELGVQPESGRFAYASAPRARMGVILHRLGLRREAAEQLRVAAAINDGDPIALLELGLVLLEGGQAAEADAVLVRAQGLHARRSAPDALRNGIAVGRAALQLGDWRRAQDAFLGVAAAGASGELALEADAGSIAAAYLAGDFRVAADLAGEAVATHGAAAELLYLRGITEAAAGGAAGEVVRDLRAAAAAAPFDAAPALSALAFWLDRIGEEDAARQTLGEALELAPSHLYSRYLAGHWATRDGDYEAALSILEPLAGEAAGSVGILADFSWAALESGEVGRASVGLRRCRELFPSRVSQEPGGRAWGDLALRHGLVLLRAGRVVEAQEAFERALSQDAALHAARNAQAVALYEDGDLDAAIAEFGFVMDALRADELDPQYLYAQVWQRRIEEHDRVRRWTEEFSGGRAKAGWNLQSGAREGVEPRVIDDRLTVRGNHRGKGMTRAYRELPAMSFRSFGGALEVASGNLGSAGVYVALMNRNNETWFLRVYRDREGMLQWLLAKGSGTESGSLDRRVEEGRPVRIEFRVDREETQPRLIVRVDGETLWSGDVANLRNPAGTIACGIYVETGNALPVDASLDDVEMTYVNPR